MFGIFSFVSHYHDGWMACNNTFKDIQRAEKIINERATPPYLDWLIEVPAEKNALLTLKKNPRESQKDKYPIIINN